MVAIKQLNLAVLLGLGLACQGLALGSDEANNDLDLAERDDLDLAERDDLDLAERDDLDLAERDDLDLAERDDLDIESRAIPPRFGKPKSQPSGGKARTGGRRGANGLPRPRDLDLAERDDFDIESRAIPPRFGKPKSQPSGGKARTGGRRGANGLPRPRDLETRRGRSGAGGFARRPGNFASGGGRGRGPRPLQARTPPSTPKGKGGGKPTPKSPPKKGDTQTPESGVYALSMARKLWRPEN